jgi:hypothetical protein
MNIKIPAVPENEIIQQVDKESLQILDDQIKRYLIDINKIECNIEEMFDYYKNDDQYSLKMISSSILLAYHQLLVEIVQKIKGVIHAE